MDVDQAGDGHPNSQQAQIGAACIRGGLQEEFVELLENRLQAGLLGREPCGARRSRPAG